ncbi:MULTISPECIES: response regulator [unclassified Caballeronia]|uniref:hybrid sensor histidine kinase/response regulator n=1 Tax=unclassified Caballeronia TaxID=2646786 RepID=UPI0028559320|nr:MULTISPECIES: response regulator [unclassified Caballeronia]MDR5739912.1 response regulator [Caballeronia sp. LZ016]MDR5808378.1 response regulator [Caballeronia sp. LZ019]
MKSDWSEVLILNVDDNDGARYAKTRILSRAGFNVIEAGTGTAALERVRAESPDLVLLDVKLPDINGLEVCRQIKASPETAGTLVLQTSAAAVHSLDRIRGLEGGADSYLTEPVEPAELIAHVRALLRVRLAESALRESEERFRQLADNIDDVFWMLDPAANTLLYVSPAYARLWDSGEGAPPPHPGADHWSGEIHPLDREHVAAAYRQLLASGAPYQVEYRIARAHGGPRWVAERASQVRGADGRPVRIAGIVNDISERKAAEMLLRDADRRKDEFLAMLAHELRNPLAPIRNAVDLLDPQRAPSVQHFATVRTIIDRQVRHLSRLVDDLLDVARITQGKITLRQETVDVAAAVEAAIETAQPALERKRHKLTTRLADAPLYIVGDSVRIAQVFGNLLSNASKYSLEEGEIAIETAQFGDEVRIAVRDKGIGITADILPHIFDLFVQSETSLERSEGGLGIGLPLAKTLVELQGGRIEAHSAGPQQGSEFVVWLPLANEPPPAPHHADEAPRVTGGKRVLLVDDSVDAATAMALLLEADGFDVRTAHEGAEALEIAEAFLPQIVLLDIGLPGMDGYRLAAEMRTRPATADALLIAVTGYGQAHDRQRSKEAGFDHHLVKPVAFAEIQRAVQGRFGE